MPLQLQPMLVVFGGLPGVGKTTIARQLATRLTATYLRIDTIEQALRREGALITGKEGYLTASALAEENLSVGQTVIADCVNPLPVTRELWRKAAVCKQAALCQIEVICSDAAEHKRRVEARVADISGHKLPSWAEVMARNYEEWPDKNIILDTATTDANSCVELIAGALAQAAGRAVKLDERTI